MSAPVVTANGFPKSGNHALVKGLQLLGVPCSVNHIPFGEPVAGRHVFIKRDPRNVLCSWLRFNRQQVTPGLFISAFRQFQARPLVDEMGDYEGWLSATGTLVVRYEDLIASDAEMRLIALWLGVPYIAGAWEALPRLTYSWRWPHSDYADVWTPEVAAVWQAEGGPALLKAWGY